MVFFPSVFLPSSRLLGLSLIKSGSYASQPHLTRPGLPVLKARKSELKSGDHDIELRCYSPTNSWTRERNDVPTLFKYYNIGPVSLLRIHFTSRTYWSIVPAVDRTHALQCIMEPKSMLYWSRGTPAPLFSLKLPYATARPFMNWMLADLGRP